jgi:hypothetical protein
MFVIVICGGPNDGDRISTDGWASGGAVPPYKFDDYADAQEFIESKQAALVRGDFGAGATLAIDEI